MPVEIRSVRANDELESLTELIHRSYAPHLAQGLRFWGAHQAASDTEKRFRSGTGLLLLVDGKPAGTLTVRPPLLESPVAEYRDPSTFSLAQFCVAPEFAGKGLGRRLHDHAVELARQAGAAAIALDTAKPALGLIKLYEAWGYAIVAECDWRPHTNYLSVVMRKRLAETPGPT